MPQFLSSHARPASPRRARLAGHGYGESAEPNWRSIDWVSHLRRGEFGGEELSYVQLTPDDPEAAARTPALFVHGLAGQWQNWLENLPRMALERPVLAPDLPGFGLSPMPREEITIPGYARTLGHFCQRLGLERVGLVGNSMGGFVAAELALRSPALVERLVLVSAAGITSANLYRAPILTLGRLAGALTARTAARQRALARRPIARHLALALVARHPSRIAPDLAYEGMVKGAGKPGFEQALRANLDYDFRERLPDVGCPTLIVWGEDDAVISVRDADEFERLIPDARKLLMRDTGHVPQLERPGAFNEQIVDFLAERGAAEAKEPVPGASQVA